MPARHSQILLHLFLAERIHLVHFAHTPRKRSPGYAFLVLALAIATGLGVWCILERKVFLVSVRGATECQIGVDVHVSYGIIAMHIITELSYAGGFVWGLMKLSSQVSRGRRVLVRSLVASCVSLAVSLNNYAQLPFATAAGHEQAWIAFAVAAADIIINAIVMFSITSPIAGPASSRPNTSMDHETAGGGGALASSHLRCPSSTSPSGHTNFSPFSSMSQPLGYGTAGGGLGLDLESGSSEGLFHPFARRSPGQWQPRSPKVWRTTAPESHVSANDFTGRRSSLRNNVTFVSLPRRPAAVARQGEMGEGPLELVVHDETTEESASEDEAKKEEKKEELEQPE